MSKVQVSKTTNCNCSRDLRWDQTGTTVFAQGTIQSVMVNVAVLVSRGDVRARAVCIVPAKVVSGRPLESVGGLGGMMVAVVAPASGVTDVIPFPAAVGVFPVVVGRPVSAFWLPAVVPGGVGGASRVGVVAAPVAVSTVSVRTAAVNVGAPATAGSAVSVRKLVVAVVKVDNDVSTCTPAGFVRVMSVVSVWRVLETQPTVPL
ncbi:hypothetical protein BDP55DRAFT_56434 [Colletotrichum godetiae]|uniref:Uncharacterized protein n=1 Tax=Colletotrichum godetiae TaxID=1209918 RepID=A0AAJ0A6N5_9PEZI|nr:uncharacterized protein BDP55DRAFT_56434 [Colletotrichum godetiae]KAK1656873.1 hypothetical protein BDP55DRAFT_56434 [Colletotrichum godetiae]